MKAKLTIAFLALWLAAPNRVANAETPPEPDKMASAPTIFVMCCVVAVAGAGVWTALKLRKRYGGTNGLFSPQRRFGTNLLSALTGTDNMSVISGEAQDIPYLLSLATAQDGAGRYHLESSSDMVSWTEIGRYQDDGFLAVSEANGQAGYFRVRVE